MKTSSSPARNATRVLEESPTTALRDARPWDAHAEPEVRQAFTELEARASTSTAFRAMLQLVAKEHAWASIGVALVELAPRGGCPSANDIRVYASGVRSRRDRIAAAGSGTLRTRRGPVVAAAAATGVSHLRRISS